MALATKLPSEPPHHTSIWAEPRRSRPRFAFGDMDEWRAAFLVSLGWVAAGCGDSTAGLPERLSCENDRPADDASGLWQCDNGLLHRVEPRAAPCDAGCIDPFPASSADECSSDGDCTEGLCIASLRLTDAPIDACRDTASAVAYFACQSSFDRCASNEQCGGALCASVAGGPRRCIQPSTSSCGPAVPGRPYLVDDRVRVASLRAGNDGWCGPAVSPAPELSARERSLLARHWQDAALMEHASIAAFARFTLQLLELGAPLELCLASQAAQADETQHARACFALAARYAGVESAPGPLAMHGALVDLSLEEIVRLTFREGCVGETLAALDAAEARAAAQDHEVCQALGVIAEDERRHSELAWRFVAWALEGHGERLRPVIEAELERMITSAPSTAPAAIGGELEPALEARLERHGVLRTAQRSALRKAVVTDIVIPCARGLLARHVAESASAERRPCPPIA